MELENIAAQFGVSIQEVFENYNNYVSYQNKMIGTDAIVGLIVSIICTIIFYIVVKNDIFHIIIENGDIEIGACLGASLAFLLICFNVSFVISIVMSYIFFGNPYNHAMFLMTQQFLSQ